MCGRYTVLTEDEIIEIREIIKDISLRIVRDDFDDYDEKVEKPECDKAKLNKTAFASPDFPTNFVPHTHGYQGEVRPTNAAPVITRNDKGIVFENVKWGFKKWNSPGVIINARSETLRDKSTFSKHLETGRCVVPAGEFFEWEKIGKSRKKHYAKDRNGNLLFMAGLYRDRKDANEPDGWIREFVIITKDATGEMAKIHDRLPVILRTDQIEAWLTGEMTPEDIVTMEYDVMVKPCENEDAYTQLELFSCPP